MSEPPEDRSPGLERFIEAISEGDPVEWEREAERRDLDPATLEALRLVETASRIHRRGGGTAPGRSPSPRGETDRESPAAERTWGNLRIRGPLGAGVYGEVYRAFDPGLRKEVALKLWAPTSLALTIDQLLEEGRKLARIRHPNILLVLGADVHDGQVGMWTELLEGATFEQLLASLGPAHWREIAGYGIDLCRALNAVHAVGLVHRDVKAANVMRERGGRIVLMDFGSAHAYAASGSEGVGPAVGPSPGGEEGTPLAMAPEVLRGEHATPASDLYSLGVLIFRLVAGRYPLHAETLEELRAALDRGPLPSLRSVRPDVPDEFARVVDRALARDPRARFASAVEMERALAGALTSVWLAPPGSAASVQASGSGGTLDTGRKRRIAAGVALVALLAAAAAGAWWLRRPASEADLLPMQFTLDLPVGEHLNQFANLVVSPDGSTVAFASVDTSGTTALWVRRFDSLSSTRLPGTEGATYPFWSPDSRQIAFYAGGNLKRVGTNGDSVRVICQADLGRGGSWGRDGTVLLAPMLQGPLLRVPASGGRPVPATTVDSAVSEQSHRWPFFLPDGEHFLYVTLPEHNATYSLFVGSLGSGRRVYVGPVESGVVYSSGMLIYMVNEGLEARPFDLRTLRWSGDPRPLSAIPGYGGSVAEPHASVSRNGTLVYAMEAVREGRLVWIDAATGAETAVARGPYFDPALSPDGRRIAVERVEGSGRSNVWMIDVASGAVERWTDLPNLNYKPVWSPAGDSLLWSSNRSGRNAIYVRRADGSLAERLVVPAGPSPMMWATCWPRHGSITLTRYDAGSSWNLYELRAGVPVPLVRTPAAESRCSVSPDGRWLAFDSNRSGRTHIQLMDLRTREQFMLPTEGGLDPHWASAAGTLFFRTPANDFYEVTPVAGRRPTEWPVRHLLRTAVPDGYDVDADGKRLLCCLKSHLGRPEEVAVLVNLREAVAKGN